MSNLKFLFQKEERRDNYPPFELPEISKGQKNDLPTFREQCHYADAVPLTSLFYIPSKNPASLYA